MVKRRITTNKNMGMFDTIKCKYPLPLAGANDLAYQTKDTDSQCCDLYEIREDGTLWHETYDTEDRSEVGKWMKENPGKEVPETFGLLAWAGCGTRVNQKWEQVNITGEICFYTMYGVEDGRMKNVTSRNGWVEWSAYFVNGKLNQLNLVENRIPESA